MQDQITSSLIERFHSVQSVLPADQVVMTVSPDEPVAAALAKLADTRFSQLVVAEGREVFGLFSYRSFSDKVRELGKLRRPLSDVPVEAFMERVQFARPTASWESLMEAIDRDDAVVVGSESNLVGIITAIDFTNFLKRVADPFVLVAEIEQALRAALRAVAAPDELRAAAIVALSSKYGRPEQIPDDPANMTFNEYVRIVGNKSNWAYFDPLFGSHTDARRETVRRLENVNRIRNDAFHFKRRIEARDMEQLREQRDWLRRRLRVFSAKEQARGASDVEAGRARQWGERAFFKKLGQNVGSAEVKVAQALHTWGMEHMPDAKWGRGKVYGSFTPGLNYRGAWNRLFAVWTNGYVELQFQHMPGMPPFDNRQRRTELLDRINRIEGVNISRDRLDARPPIDLSLLVPTESLNCFLEAAAWFVATVRANQPADSGYPERRFLFWTQLLEKARDVTSLHANRNPGRNTWLSTGAGVSGLEYLYVIRMGDARVELYIDRGDEAENQRILAALEEKRSAIEGEFGHALSWLPLHGKRACKIAFTIKSGGLRDESKWPETQHAMIETMARFSRSLQPHVNNLSL